MNPLKKKNIWGHCDSTLGPKNTPMRKPSCNSLYGVGVSQWFQRLGVKNFLFLKYRILYK